MPKYGELNRPLRHCAYHAYPVDADTH